MKHAVWCDVIMLVDFNLGELQYLHFVVFNIILAKISTLIEEIYRKTEKNCEKFNNNFDVNNTKVVQHFIYLGS